MKRNVIRLPLANVSFRAADDGPEGILVGYASVWDVEYRIGWGVKETVSKGAFAESLKARGGVVPLFYQHDWANPIGIARASEDDHGLRVEAEIFMDTERGRSVWRAAQAGALREWSIGFMPEEITTRSDDDTGNEVEEIVKGDLMEASVVVKGANPDTMMVEVRSADDPDPEPVACETCGDACVCEDLDPSVEDEVEAEARAWLDEAVTRSWFRDELGRRLAD